MTAILSSRPLRLAAVLAVVLTSLLVPAVAASAQTTTVFYASPTATGAVPCAQSSPCSLTGAIAAAEATAGPVEILVGPGTYSAVISGTTTDYVIDDTSTASGSSFSLVGSGQSSTVLDGSAVNLPLMIEDTTTVPVTLSHLSVENGYGLLAGGIASNMAEPLSVTNVTITGCTSETNGGGLSGAASATISNSTFTGDAASDEGGGAQDNGSAIVSNSTFTGNIASEGAVCSSTRTPRSPARPSTQTVVRAIPPALAAGCTPAARPPSPAQFSITTQVPEPSSAPPCRPPTQTSRETQAMGSP